MIPPLLTGRLRLNDVRVEMLIAPSSRLHARKLRAKGRPRSHTQVPSFTRYDARKLTLQHFISVERFSQLGKAGTCVGFS